MRGSEWSWRSFFSILSIFLVGGPFFAIAAYCVAATLFSGEGLAGLAALPSIFVIAIVAGYQVGAPFALVTGATFATLAVGFGRSTNLDACLAALFAQFAILGVATAALGPPSDIDNPGTTYFVGILVPSLVSAPLCAALARRRLRPPGRSKLAS